MSTLPVAGPYRANNLLIEVANGMALEIAIVRPPAIGRASVSTDQARATARLLAAAPEQARLLTEALALLQDLIPDVDAAQRPRAIRLSGRIAALQSKVTA